MALKGETTMVDLKLSGRELALVVNSLEIRQMHFPCQGQGDRKCLKGLIARLDQLFADLQKEVGLSPREGEIVPLIAQGKTNKQIGELLGISEQSIKNEVSSILKKTGLRNRLQIALRYRQGGNHESH